MCEARGVKLIYFPPYSPDLNPIEECFSFVKSYIRRHGTCFRAMVEASNRAGPYQFLYEALASVAPAHTWNFFDHSGYM
jgi:hypothetical protein